MGVLFQCGTKIGYQVLSPCSRSRDLLIPISREFSSLLTLRIGPGGKMLLGKSSLPPTMMPFLISLSRGGEDSFAWAFEKSGNYTVKTAYRALMTRNERLAREEGTATGTSGNDQQLWKALWKLNVIPKVRVFWWRVLRGILPDESTLKYHHIAVIGRCKVCMAMGEDLKHGLIHCVHARRFWDHSSCAVMFLSFASSNLMRWLEHGAYPFGLDLLPVRLLHLTRCSFVQCQCLCAVFPLGGCSGDLRCGNSSGSSCSAVSG